MPQYFGKRRMLLIIIKLGCRKNIVILLENGCSGLKVAWLEGTKPIKPINMEGTVPIMPLIMEGTPPLTGRALPNLINAVKTLKSTSKPHWLTPR